MNHRLDPHTPPRNPRCARRLLPSGAPPANRLTVLPSRRSPNNAYAEPRTQTRVSLVCVASAAESSFGSVAGVVLSGTEMTSSGVTLVALGVFGVAFWVAFLRAVFFGVAFDLFDRVALRPTVRPPRLAAVTRVLFDARLATTPSVDSIDSIGPPRPPYHIAPRREARSAGVAATVNNEEAFVLMQAGWPVNRYHAHDSTARAAPRLVATSSRRGVY
jgi:hypothetical protein